MPPLKTRLWSRWGSPPLRLANARPHPRLHRRALSTTCIKKQPSLGSTNRLAPGPSQARKGAGSCFKIEDAEDDKFLELPDSLEPSSRGLPVSFLSKSLRRQLRRWRASWADVWGKASYRYYNWRQDTLSDLQLFVVFNFVLFCLGAWIEGTIMKRLDGRADEPSTDGAPEWWADFYSVMGWVLGQDLPQSNEVGLPSQVFAVLTVVLGLASFALVLALIEQVVLEVLESNVKRGSAVYEKDHTVVLAWCESSYDLSQLSRMLWQLVHGARGSSNNVVVVLTQNREKLEMEALFREAIPPPERLGTKFVFRQGSPLEPIALQMVAATKARAVIVCGDGARSSLDSDAECLRAAVLLDEMITAEVGLARGPRIVVQIKSPDPVPVLKYACSPRVIGVPTMVAQARRVSRMLRQPIAGLLSNMLLNYSSKAHVAIHAYPQLVGLPFQELHAYFPYAVLVGILNSSTGYSKINPDPHKVLQLGDELMMLRPGPAAYCPAAAPLEQPPCVDLGGWDPSQYFLESQDEDPLGISSLTASESLDGGRPTPPPQQRGLADFASTQAANEGEEGSSDDENSGLLLSARKALGYLGRAAGRSEGPQQQPQQSQGYFVLPLQIGGWKLGLATSDLLICGWGGASFMWTLLEELDHGPEALAPGTTVTLVNNHDNLPGLVDGQWVSRGIENLKLNHVKADPRSRTQLQNALDIGQYKACIVLTDLLWLEAGGASQGAQAQALTQPEMLRLEAATLLVQMNVRYLLQEAGLPEFGFIVEKMTSSGSTRFEDPYRLPQGLPINHTTFCAKILGGAAFDPRFLKPYSELGTHSGLVVQDSSAFAAVGEEISFLQLQARAAAVRQCVIGYYSVPDSTDTPLDVVINPQGLAARSRKQVFNRGDLGCKVVSLALTKAIRSSKNGTLTSSVGSRDFEEHPAESRAGQAAAEERLPDEGAVAAAAATD